MKKGFFSFIVAALLASLCSAFAQDGPVINIKMVAREGGTIVDYLSAHAGSEAGAACINSADTTAFTCLNEALLATGLSEELRSSGEFTLFAPTDGAFQQLAATMDAGAWNALFTDAAALRALLSDHLVPTKLTLGEMFDRTNEAYRELMVITLDGAQVPVAFDAEGEMSSVTLGKESSSNVLESVVLDNGVIIAIDKVLVINN